MIRTENSLEGYMLNELFGPVQPDNVVEEIGMGRYMYIDTDAANLREGPTTDSERISVAYRDEKVYQIATNGGWSRIKTEGGITAYIRNDLIRETPRSILLLKRIERFMLTPVLQMCESWRRPTLPSSDKCVSMSV